MDGRREAFEALDQPQKRGDAAEAIIRSEFLVRDVPVLIPAFDNEPYDLVVEVDGTFLTVQCKTAYGDDDGVVRFETRSTRVTATGYERTSYIGRVTYFAVYNPVLDVVYLVDVDEAPVGTMTIRWGETHNNQRTRVNWHADYLLDAVLGARS